MAQESIPGLDFAAANGYWPPGKGKARPKIVCLCGSSFFRNVVAVKAWEFEKQGILALGMHLLPQWYTGVADHLAEHEGVAETLDELHLEKIQLADFVYVVNKGGYIGARTKIEIEFAESLGKPVEYMERVEGA